MNAVNPPSSNVSGGKHRFTVLSAVLALVMMPATVQAGPEFQISDESSMKVTYAVQMWLQNRDYTSDKDSGEMTDFWIRRNRVAFIGQYNDYISYYFQFEGAPDSRGGNDARSVYYRDAYLTLDMSDPVRFIIGRFKQTFSRENLEACLEPLTLDRGLGTYTPYGPSRDTGLVMWGNLADAMFQYRFMVADGREGDYVAKDSPRLTARVHATLWDPEFDYGYRGTYLGVKKILTIGAAYDYQADIAYADYSTRSDPQDYTGKTVDIFMEYPTGMGTFTLSGAKIEYDMGGAINKDPDPGLSEGGFTQLKMTYVKAGYLLPNKVGIGRLQFFARNEKSEHGLTSGYRDQTVNIAGFNYYINGQQLKVTFEYTQADFDIDHPTDKSLQDYNQAMLGLQFIL